MYTFWMLEDWNCWENLYGGSWDTGGRGGPSCEIKEVTKRDKDHPNGLWNAKNRVVWLQVSSDSINLSSHWLEILLILPLGYVVGVRMKKFQLVNQFSMKFLNTAGTLWSTLSRLKVSTKCLCGKYTKIIQKLMKKSDTDGFGW